MSPRFTPLSLAELADLQLPEREDVIGDALLVAGSVTLFAAREKSGKTLLCTDAACSIASEEPFLNRAVKCGPVIFIALEENIREVRQRIFDRLGSRRDVPLYVLPANGFTEDVFRLDDPNSMLAFAAMIREYEARAVFIDTMREAHSLRENEADDMAPLARPLRQIAHETNCAIVLLHHMNKLGTARGSTAITAAADQLWTFRRTDSDEDQAANGNPVGKLGIEGRFGPPQLLGIRLGDQLRWQIDNAITLTHTDQSMRGRFLDALRHGEPAGMTYQDIATVLDAKHQTVQNEATRLLKETPPLIVAHGTGKRGDARRYALVAPELLLTADSPTVGRRGVIENNSSQSSGSNGSNPTTTPHTQDLGGERGVVVSGAVTPNGRIYGEVDYG